MACCNAASAEAVASVSFFFESLSLGRCQTARGDSRGGFSVNRVLVLLLESFDFLARILNQFNS